MLPRNGYKRTVSLIRLAGFHQNSNRRKDIMRKTTLSILILLFLILWLAGVCYGWQGRMGGMEDPYGLVQDESDFLIHPSEIATGGGMKFYGNYRFTYRDVMDWNYTMSSFDPVTGALLTEEPFKGSGDENEHDALLGSAFPLGQGRMGLFFQYAGKKGDFDGKNNEFFSPDRYYHTYSLDSDLDTFALRLLYGHPMGVFKLGGEIELAYRSEENETFESEDLLLGDRALHTNQPFGAYFQWLNLFPFMFPYDSKYWEALFKGSLSGAVADSEYAFTMWSGFIFAGDNKLEHRLDDPFLGSGTINMDGNVEGWRIGGELWLRSPLAENFSLPILLKADYRKKTRDGDGMGTGFYAGESFDYENRERVLHVEAGGGLDMGLNRGTRIAAGIYYNYIENKNDFVLNESAPGLFGIYDHSKYPDSREHRVILRLAGENEFAPHITMRMGLSIFYGFLEEDFRFNFTDGIDSTEDETSLDGHHWGIGASMGATIKVQRVILEPFIGGGYQKLDIDGDGFSTSFGGALLEMDKLRENWSIGGGLSIKF
jgi:hypothetical protein